MLHNQSVSQDTLYYHLRYNALVTPRMMRPATQAIRLCASGRERQLVQCGTAQIPASEIVDDLHLWEFVDTARAEVE